MKGFLRGVALGLVLMLCAMPVLAHAEGSLLGQRMEQAYGAGRQIEATLTAKLSAGMALFLPQETFGMLEQLLADTRIVTRWAKDEADNPAMELEIGIKDVRVLTGEVRVAGDALAVMTSLLPDKALLVPLSDLGEVMQQQQTLPLEMDEQTLALFEGALETYFGIVLNWAMESEGLYVQSEAETAGTDARSGSVRSDHVVMTGAQCKELLVRLSAQFAQDEELQSALDQYLQATGAAASTSELAKELADAAQSLVPLGGTLRMDAYTGADGELVGLDIEIDPMFEGMPQSAFARYDRLDGDGLAARAFQGRIGLEDGGMAAAKVNYRAEESPAESKTTSDLLLMGMAQTSADEPINQITLTDKRETVQDPGQERLDDALELVVEQLTPDGSAQVESSMPMSAAINTLSIANAGAGDDFDSDVTVAFNAFGMEFASLNLKMESAAYAPVDISGYETVDLSTATEADQQALLQELQAGLSQAIMSAMAVIPPELQQMILGA